MTGSATKDDLERLAVRVESATGPDRALDAEIAVAVDWGSGEAYSARYLHEVGNSFADIGRYFDRTPRYTASIDAAMSLVPEGWAVASLEWWPMRKSASVTLYESKEFGHGRSGYDEKVCRSARSAHVVATPALALTAAALRSRSHGEK